MSRVPLARLRDARHFAVEASQIAMGMDPDIFEDNNYYHYAMRYCLLAIGEALRHVPAEIRAEAPAIAWRPIISMRHRLAHDYWLIDSRMVLEAGERHTRPLIEELDLLIERVNSAGPA